MFDGGDGEIQWFVSWDGGVMEVKWRVSFVLQLVHLFVRFGIG